MTTEYASEIDDLLSAVYTDDGIEIWWNARNRNLGGRRPADMLKNGNDEDRERLLAEAERLAGGCW